MTIPRYTDRRTVLKTIGAAGIAGTAMSGVATARPGDAGRSPSTTDVTIVAEHDHDTGDHFFNIDTPEVPSGWTTIEFDNDTTHTHFALLQKIPQAAIDEAEQADKDLLEYWDEQIIDPFQVFMDWILGKTPNPPSFPSWFGDIEPAGGPGLTTGGYTTKTTQYLDPGKYQVECYVKNKQNQFHSYLGMSGLLTVTDAESDDREPNSTLNLSLSNTGLDAPESVRPGMHRVAVNFAEQQAYSHLLGHDIHLIRYDDDTTRADVNGWMDWSNGFGATGDQLVSDGSEPGTFLGGVQNIWHVTSGTYVPRTGYAHVRLEPGEYAWVAEVPNPDAEGLLKEFTVPGQGQGGGPP